MSNAKTGLASATGALLVGALGAYAGLYASRMRPRARYVADGPGDQVEDAMVVGGAAGAVVGAFLGGTIFGKEDPPPALQQRAAP